MIFDVRLIHPFQLNAIDNQSIFEHENTTQSFKIGNFLIQEDGFHSAPSDQISAYRVTAGLIEKIENVNISNDYWSIYNVELPSGSEPAKYYVRENNYLSAEHIKKANDNVEDITSGQAEYLIISHPDFMVESTGLLGLTDLAEHRSKQYSTKIVSTEDIYGQFGDGQFGALAIVNYIRHAILNMNTRFVLLVGDDTNDYKSESGWSGFVPTMWSPDECAPDCSNSFCKPDDFSFLVSAASTEPLFQPKHLAIGRFPVTNLTQLQNIIKKTLTYDDSSRIRTLFGMEFGVIRDYAQRDFYRPGSDKFNRCTPDWNIINQIDVDLTGTPATRDALLDAINDGVGVVSAYGHAGGNYNSTWGGVLKSTDAPNLTNYNNPFVMVHSDSYQHDFASGYIKLAEEMINAEGGAVISIGHSNLLGSHLAPISDFASMWCGYATILRTAFLTKDAPVGLQSKIVNRVLLGDPALVLNPSD